MKTVLITGGASGIGLATATRLARTMQVIIVDRDGARAQAAAQTLNEAGARAQAYAADVTKSDEIAAMMRDAARDVGPIHAMFCNAGVSLKHGVEEITEADWDLMIKTHVKGVFLCTKADREIVIHCLVVKKVVFDHIAFVSKAKDKFIEPVMRIYFHDMPKDRTTTDFDHWFRPIFSFFSKSSALATT